MKFFHGTTEENWEKIQKEGVLWGKPSYNETWGAIEDYEKHFRECKNPYRYTYLTPDLDIAHRMGSEEVTLEVEYDPVGVDGRGIDNYAFGPESGQIVKPGDHCWQFSVFVPIPIKKVKVFSRKKV